MTNYDSIEIIHDPTIQTVSAAKAVWKRFTRHRGAIAGAIIFGILILMCVLAPLSPYDPEKSNLPDKFQPPSASHFLGTDALDDNAIVKRAELHGSPPKLLNGFACW